MGLHTSFITDEPNILGLSNVFKLFWYVEIKKIFCSIFR